MQRLISALLLIMISALPVAAHSPFSPAIHVNDDVITHWELDQRTRMYEVLGSPGDPAEFAREQLIDDRVKLNAARLAGIRISEAELDGGVADFAARSGRSTEELHALLRQRGVDPATLRDFVEAALTWRRYVRVRFRGRAQISEADIDRAMATASDRGSLRLRFAEIIIPTPPEKKAEATALANRISAIRSFEAFSAAAREHSAAQSRDNGGLVPWRDTDELPGGLAQILLRLEIGEVSEPLDLQGRALALLQLRGLEENPAPPARVVSLSWAELRIAGGHDQAALEIAQSIGQRVDQCQDLYGATQDMTAALGEGVVTEREASPAEIPQDIQRALAALDPGEISTTVTRDEGETLLMLMLCERVTEITETITRDQVADQLIAQRLNLLADAHLKGLRADARIRQ